MIDPATFDFLTELDQNNNKAWFDEHRAEYKRLRKEFEGFLTDLAQRMAFFDPEIQLHLDDPKLVKIFRINRDVRFSNDKRPYKTNLAGTIGPRLGDGHPIYYVNIQRGDSAAGGGIYMPPSPVLKVLREKVDEEYGSLDAIVTDPAFQAQFPEGLTRHGALKTAPRGYSVDHPGIDYLRLKSFAALRSFDDKEVTREDFDEEVLAAFEALSKLNAFLTSANLPRG